MDTGEWVVVGLSIFLGAWFLVGFLYNRNQGLALESWLRMGLQEYGKVVKAPGSNPERGKLSVERPAEPFRKLEVSYRLEVRENMPLWLFNHLKGVRDEVLLKAVIKKAPAQEIEAGSLDDPEFTRWVDMLKKDGYRSVPAPQGYDILSRGQAEPERLECLRKLIELYPGGKMRVSLRSKETHLSVRASLAALNKKPGEIFFSAAADLAREAA